MSIRINLNWVRFQNFHSVILTIYYVMFHTQCVCDWPWIGPGFKIFDHSHSIFYVMFPSQRVCYWQFSVVLSIHYGFDKFQLGSSAFSNLFNGVWPTHVWMTTTSISFHFQVQNLSSIQLLHMSERTRSVTIKLFSSNLLRIYFVNKD